MKKIGETLSTQGDCAAFNKALKRLEETFFDPKQQEKRAEQARISGAQTTAQSNVVQLPLWPEPARGVPNSTLRGALFAAIQGKTRTALKREVLAVQKGVTIRFTGWQLDQSDLDVWEQALHLARHHPLGTRCEFTAYGFLKGLERAVGKKNHEWLKDAFARLAGCAVEITHDRFTYGGSLLEFLRDEETGRYVIEINPKLRKLYTAGWTITDWQQRRMLKRKPLALWLHGFYASHAEPLPMKVQTLMQLSGSHAKLEKHFKANLKTALGDLKAIGCIDSHSIEGDLVSVTRTPSDSQQKHLRKTKLRNKN